MRVSTMNKSRKFNFDYLPRIWCGMRKESKDAKGKFLSPLLFTRLLPLVFMCDLIAVPNEATLESIAVVDRASRDDEEVTIEVVRCAYPGKERSKDSLAGLLEVLNKYHCDHGVIINFKRAVIFEKVEDGQGDQTLKEIREIELTKNGYKDLGHYWCSLKPQFLLDFEERFRSDALTAEDLIEDLPPLRRVREADKEPAPVRMRNSIFGRRGKKPVSTSQKRKAVAAGEKETKKKKKKPEAELNKIKKS